MDETEVLNEEKKKNARREKAVTHRQKIVVLKHKAVLNQLLFETFYVQSKSCLASDRSKRGMGIHC